MSEPLPVRVLYNATSARVGGGLTYACAQVDALADFDDIHLTVIVSLWNSAALKEVVGDRAEVRLVRVPNATARYAWEQLVLPFVARAHDVLVSPGNLGCLLVQVPQVVVLQNLLYVGRGRQAGDTHSLVRRVRERLSHASMRRADMVMSISESLTAEIGTEEGLADIDVVTVRSGSPPLGTGLAPTDPAVTTAADALVGSTPFLLTVGNDAPHKRLEDLAALARSLSECDESVPRRVVVVGAVSPQRQAELHSLAGDGSDALVFVGAVAARSVVLELCRRAVATLLTSELEAWSLTLNEASSQGCPLVVTDIPAHREVAEARAHYFPVGDVAALAAEVEAAARGPRPEPATLGWSWSDHGVLFAEHLRRLASR